MRKTDGPADTRMMAIIHGALLRDLARARDVLDSDPPPRRAQRRALGKHLVWMMAFLHAHHSSEDHGLWPLLLQRNPGAAALVDSLEADHARIMPAAEAMSAAAASYAVTTDDSARGALGVAVEELNSVLAPHLAREVAEAMPVVSRSITQGDWDAVERKFNLSSKSMTQLAFEGHWLLDGIDPEGRDIVVHLVSPVPRLILVHGFAWKYLRHSAACWSPVVPTSAALVR